MSLATRLSTNPILKDSGEIDVTCFFLCCCFVCVSVQMSLLWSNTNNAVKKSFEKNPIEMQIPLTKYVWRAAETAERNCRT